MMRGRIVVMRQEEYAEWLTPQPEGDDLAQEGASCSWRRAARVVTPKLRASMPRNGRPVRADRQLSDGRQVNADDDYIRDSILQPKRDIIAGYEPIMPSY